MKQVKGLIKKFKEENSKKKIQFSSLILIIRRIQPGHIGTHKEMHMTPVVTALFISAVSILDMPTL